MSVMDIVNIGLLVGLVLVIGYIVYKINKTVQEEKKNQVSLNKRINYKKQVAKS